MPGCGPAWLIRLGLFLYDHIGGRKRLPGCRTLDLRSDRAGRLLKDRFVRAFEYSDCWVDDARLVVLNAMDAAERGAEIRVGCELTSAAREDRRWQLSLLDRRTGTSKEVAAKVVINAAGPWVAEVLANRMRHNARASVRLVKGSHIVVPRMFDHDRAYIFQHSDQRIIFAIPYEDDFTLIGTTDVDVGDDPEAATISEQEISYLCAAVSEYFERAVTPAGRSLGLFPVSVPCSMTAPRRRRRRRGTTSSSSTSLMARAALLNVFGGKITTYRRLAGEVLEKLAPALPGIKGAWTRDTVLPGGEPPDVHAPGASWSEGHAALSQRLHETFPAIDATTARRLIRSYGTRAWTVLEGVSEVADLVTHFGAGLYQREVEYLVRHEWARQRRRQSVAAQQIGPALK